MYRATNITTCANYTFVHSNDKKTMKAYKGRNVALFLAGRNVAGRDIAGRNVAGRDIAGRNVVEASSGISKRWRGKTHSLVKFLPMDAERKLVINCLKVYVYEPATRNMSKNEK